MVKKIIKGFPIFLLLLFVIVFYTPLIFFLKLPIPADSIVGLYSPYRDFYAKDYPNGIPFKNYLITDPVRQTYVWKELVTDIYKKGQIPSWNPYEMSGKPLAANLQSGAFYPLNILFLFMPFPLSWSFFIFIQTFLIVVFTYLYLRNLKLSNSSSILGTIALGFCGFSISWLEWGNVLHSFLWLLPMLLSIDKIVKKNKGYLWYGIFGASVICSLFAGHLQVFFYAVIVSYFYFLMRWIENGKNKKIFVQFIVVNLVAILITSIQWFPTLQFIIQSARSIDQNFKDVAGWFIPWKHLAQFLAPDYFGNPATLNYFGEWNYAELVGYVGILPLVLALCSLIKANKTVVFFTIVIVVSLVFSLPTGISSLPYFFNVPFISSAQPTRLIILISFSLSIMAAFGFELLIQNKSKLKIKFLVPLIILGIAFAVLWVLALIHNNYFFSDISQAAVAKRNLLFPTAIFIAGGIAFISMVLVSNRKVKNAVLIVIILITFFDVLRFAQKFTPFSDPKYLYPVTDSINYLLSQKGVFRIASLDRRILSPNFSTHYKLQSIEGYDPLYLNNYAKFIAAMERDKPDINPPYGFNRIITPRNINSNLFPLLNVRYLLSYDEIKSPNYKLVYSEGKTKVYESKNLLARSFFVNRVINSSEIDPLFKIDGSKEATAANFGKQEKFTVGKVKIVKYEENEININTSNNGIGFLVLTDVYYPTWKAYIDGVETKIYLTDFTFRGVVVPAGNHSVIFRNNLF